MNFLYNQKFANVFNLTVVAPVFLLFGLDKFPTEYKKYLVYVAIFIGVVSFIKLAKLTNLIKKVKVLSLIEGMENTECSAVHHIKIFDAAPSLSHPILKIKTGECVIWTNVGELQHSVVSNDNFKGFNNQFSSKSMFPGEFYGIKFKEPGVYTYYCMDHKGGASNGVVTVV